MTILKVSVVALVVFLTGCASQRELSEVRQLAEQSYQTATLAYQIATDAATCCANTNERINRMYQKLTSK